VAQVKADMEKASPMDRLICGDVGYGKTEIALRSAFKAVMDGIQVAILVPTTVLAQQHFNTFTDRLAAFPLKVEMLSRFRSDREQKAVIEGLKEGTVDICIGTHRLLQKDVAFKRLGLVIIDEEQRFGVAHKEILKQMRREVDVLTLTATPIPRTLHMAMIGVRDMSTLDIPPEERFPIRTYVTEFNEALIREAIIREMERNGQVFLVHNRVHSIGTIARRLAEIVPEARIAVAHGQMEEEQLESAMLDFYQGKVDVLLCTTIIESGLDIPNANTLIINDADKLGLAQLYQLRGRIGRGSQRAYAYFLYGKGKRLTEAAEKRLQTIFEASELGAGFRIAMKDLEIRGAGNLLGPEQSGHIAAVGFELYCQLLTEAVTELKADRSSRPEDTADFTGQLPTMDLPLSAYLPEHYIGDLNTRLSIYQRLARARSEKEVQRLEEEITDRFGRPPKQVDNLLYVMKIRILCARAGVESISRENGQLVLRFVDSWRPDRRQLQPAPRGVRIGVAQLEIALPQLGDGWRVILDQMVTTLCRSREAVLARRTAEGKTTEVADAQRRR
jgi:transcription-repair coupling factor (superfamily II helicase)